jgi:rare lipoprotein A
MFLLTAAHRELPLGTLVRVTNLRNGRAVVVRINDRGPVPKSRIIDLSYGAAQLLGLRAHGVTKVRLDLVPEDATVVAENNPETVQEK